MSITPAPSLSQVIQSASGYLIALTTGGETVKLTGNANWRNNNPGNLRPTAFTRAQPGFIGVADTSSGQFAVFDTYAHGALAQQTLLFSTTAYAGLTIAQAIAKYAPATENNVQSYISSVVNALGVAASTLMNALTPSQQQTLVTSMQKVEGYVPGQVQKISDPSSLTNASTPNPSEANSADASQVYVVNNSPPIPNRLANYANYIYSLSLHMLTNEEYNNIVVTQQYTPKNVIIASAGRHGVNFPRNPNWSEDFYFENFTMQTIISPNDESRNTNAIKCSFEIIEPYGFTMVERILKTTQDLGGSNYLDMPYLVQIDFFAMDDAGTITGALPDLQKRLPVKFTKMDIKVTERGASYTVNAIPFGHDGFTGSAITVPSNMEVTAKTVADFFQSVEGTSADSFAQAVVASSDLSQRQTTDAQAAANLNAPTMLYNSLQQNSVINVDSFGTAINAYFAGLKNAGKISIADIYRFEFLPDPDTGQDVIGSSTFVDPAANTPKATPMKKNSDVKETISMKLSDVGNSQNTYDTTRGIFSINYGTAIDKLLEYVIRNSSYIHDQLVIPDGMSDADYQARKDQMKDKPLKWFKIVPKIRLLGYDTIRKLWAKEYTYSVQPYKMYNLRSDIAPQGIVVNPVKAYNYIFTGKNSDIIHLDIVFNTLFYTQQTAYRNNQGETSPTAESINTDYQYQNAPNYSGGDAPLGVNYDAVMPLVMKPVVQNSKAVATGNPTDAKAVGAADLAESIMSSSSADMLTIKMSIIGDPDYIKQDDVFYGPSAALTTEIANSFDPRLLPNGGSLTMDQSGLYVQVLFKVPRDIDDSTGFMKYDAGQRNSVFSGLYQVLTVTSTFTKGEFTQELTMNRIPRQVAFDYVSATNNTTSNARPASSNVASTIVNSVTATPTPSSAAAADTAVDQTPGQNQQTAATNISAQDAADTPTPTAAQQDLANVRASGTTTDINSQNAPQETPQVQTPTVTDINTQFLGTAKTTAIEVRDLVMHRNSVYNLARATDSGLTRLIDQYIAQDPANGDLTDNELAAKYPDVATLVARKQNLLAQQKQLNQQITDTANSIVQSEPQKATLNVDITFNSTAKGPSPTIVVGGQRLLEFGTTPGS